MVVEAKISAPRSPLTAALLSGSVPPAQVRLRLSGCDITNGGCDLTALLRELHEPAEAGEYRIKIKVCARALLGG